jgi:hypothetical protein
MVARAQEWTLRLGPTEVAEIQAALSAWRAREGAGSLDLPAPLLPQDFPLPTLAPRLQRIKQDLLHGRGFVLIKGMPVRQWSPADSAMAFIGLGAHLGHARSQNAKGHLLGHVRDVGLASTDPNVRIYQTHERQTFHTDSCDVVALLCLREARSGGDSLLVSSTTLYNEILARRPDLAPWLFEPVATDRRGEIPAGMKPWFEIPVFNWHEGFLTALYQRQYVDSAQRFPEAPRLDPRHIEALDLLDALTNDPALNFSMRLEPGDMQFVHNHTLLHDRTAFEDHAQPDERRYLLRLWLAVPGARPLPEVFRQRYGSITIGDRGGIVVPGARPTVEMA